MVRASVARWPKQARPLADNLACPCLAPSSLVAATSSLAAAPSAGFSCGPTGRPTTPAQMTNATANPCSSHLVDRVYVWPGGGPPPRPQPSAGRRASSWWPQGCAPATLERPPGHARASPGPLAQGRVPKQVGAYRGAAAEPGVRRPVPRRSRRLPGWARGGVSAGHLVVVPVRGLDLRRASHDSAAELSSGALRCVRGGRARAGIRRLRANVAKRTLVLASETAAEHAAGAS